MSAAAALRADSRRCGASAVVVRIEPGGWSGTPRVTSPSSDVIEAHMGTRRKFHCMCSAVADASTSAAVYRRHVAGAVARVLEGRSDHAVVICYGPTGGGISTVLRGSGADDGLLHSAVQDVGGFDATCQLLAALPSDGGLVDVLAHARSAQEHRSGRSRAQQRPSQVELRPGQGVDCCTGMPVKSAADVAAVLAVMDDHYSRTKRKPPTSPTRGDDSHARAEEGPSYVVSLSVSGRRVSIVVFEASDRATGKSRRPLRALSQMLRAPDRAAAAIASRGSRLTQALQPFVPPVCGDAASTPIVVLVSVSSGRVTEHTEGALRVAEDLSKTLLQQAAAAPVSACVDPSLTHCTPDSLQPAARPVSPQRARSQSPSLRSTSPTRGAAATHRPRSPESPSRRGAEACVCGGAAALRALERRLAEAEAGRLAAEDRLCDVAVLADEAHALRRENEALRPDRRQREAEMAAVKAAARAAEAELKRLRQQLSEERRDAAACAAALQVVTATSAGAAEAEAEAGRLRAEVAAERGRADEALKRAADATKERDAAVLSATELAASQELATRMEAQSCEMASERDSARMEVANVKAERDALVRVLADGEASRKALSERNQELEREIGELREMLRTGASKLSVMEADRLGEQARLEEYRKLCGTLQQQLSAGSASPARSDGEKGRPPTPPAAPAENSTADGDGSVRQHSPERTDAAAEAGAAGALQLAAVAGVDAAAPARTTGLAHSGRHRSLARMISDRIQGKVVHVVTPQGARDGVARYVGEASFAPGIWVGLELASATGKNDGEVQGVRYFTCAPQHGVFVRAEQVQSVDARPSLTEADWSPAVWTASPPESMLSDQRQLRPAASGGASAASGDEERRVDPADGVAYSLASFVEVYGSAEGLVRWEEAAVHKEGVK